MTRKHKTRETVWAVVRYDDYGDEAFSPELVTIKEVLHDKATADSEVARLNKLNAGKKCLYWVEQTELNG